MKKTWYWVLVLLGAVLLASCSKPAPKRPKRVCLTPVERRMAEDSLYYRNMWYRLRLMASGYDTLVATDVSRERYFAQVDSLPCLCEPEKLR